MRGNNPRKRYTMFLQRFGETVHCKGPCLTDGYPYSFLSRKRWWNSTDPTGAELAPACQSWRCDNAHQLPDLSDWGAARIVWPGSQPSRRLCANLRFLGRPGGNLRWRLFLPAFALDRAAHQYCRRFFPTPDFYRLCHRFFLRNGRLHRGRQPNPTPDAFFRAFASTGCRTRTGDHWDGIPHIASLPAEKIILNIFIRCV